MQFFSLGSGVYTYHGDMERFAEALAKFKDKNPGLIVTAMSPIMVHMPNTVPSPTTTTNAIGYVVNTEEKK